MRQLRHARHWVEGLAHYRRRLHFRNSSWTENGKISVSQLTTHPTTPHFFTASRLQPKPCASSLRVFANYLSPATKVSPACNPRDARQPSPESRLARISFLGEQRAERRVVAPASLRSGKLDQIGDSLRRQGAHPGCCDGGTAGRLRGTTNLLRPWNRLKHRLNGIP